MTKLTSNLVKLLVAAALAISAPAAKAAALDGDPGDAALCCPASHPLPCVAEESCRPARAEGQPYFFTRLPTSAT